MAAESFSAERIFELVSTLFAMIRPFLGVVIGGLISAVTSWFVARSTMRRERLMFVLPRRQEAYLNALESAVAMKREFNALMTAISGRTEPGPGATPEEIAEAQRKDEAGAAAIEGIFRHKDELEQHVLHMKIFGSPESEMILHEAWEVINFYLIETFSREDHRMIAEDHRRAVKTYENKIEQFIQVVRRDLNVNEAR